MGTYTVTAEAPGFKKTVVPDVHAEVAQVVRLDLTLELGALSEHVEVSATPSPLQVADSQIGGVVENKAVADLLLNGRSYTQLMVLMAGVTEGPQGARAGGAYARKAGGLAVNVNGQRAMANSFLIDGMLAKEVQHSSTSLEPIIDALAEFRVQTSNYTAEFGTEAGGQINAVIKSGTNALHGSLWNFFRHDKLDGNNFFINRAATARPAFRRNQFGAAAGGPVLLPGYNGRNRTFIFGAYEGTRIRKGITQLTTVPDATLRTGNLSSLGRVTDPFSGLPFPDNTIPASRIHRSPAPCSISTRHCRTRRGRTTGSPTTRRRTTSKPTTGASITVFQTATTSLDTICTRTPITVTRGCSRPTARQRSFAVSTWCSAGRTSWAPAH